ncbi:hypothetical protein L9F63_027160, partial [Diploptera punctata]
MTHVGESCHISNQNVTISLDRTEFNISTYFHDECIINETILVSDTLEDIHAYQKFVTLITDYEADSCLFGVTGDLEERILRGLHYSNNWSTLLFPYYRAFHYHGRSDISGYLIIIRLYESSAIITQIDQILIALDLYRMLKYSALFIIVITGEVDGFNVDDFIKLLVDSSVFDIIVLVTTSQKWLYDFIHAILTNYLQDNVDHSIKVFLLMNAARAFLNGFPIESLVILEYNSSDSVYVSGFSNRSVVFIIFKYIFEAMKMTLNTNFPNFEEIKDHLIINLNLDFYQSRGEQFIRYYTAEYYWYLQKSEALPRWSIILCVFSNYLWICMFFVLLFTVFVLQYMSKSANYVPPWWLNLISLHLGIGIREPKEHYLRIILLSWLIYSTSINTTFQCFFTSYLVDTLYQHQIDTYEELVEENYELIFAKDNFVFTGNVYNTTSCMKWVDGEVDSLVYLHNGVKRAVFIPHESVSYFYNTICDGNVRNNLHRIINSQKQIYVLLNRLIESGIPDKLVNDILHLRGKSFKSMLDMNSNELVTGVSHT